VVTQQSSTTDFAVTRLGIIMRPQPGEPYEASGVLNPAGARAPDGSLHLFPRYVDHDNLSRIGHARVHAVNDIPHHVERIGTALDPEGPHEAGGCQDARVTFVPLLERYVMTYTAVGADGPHVAVAISDDLGSWQRLGPVRYEIDATGIDLNACMNKDAALFSDVIFDPQGVPSFGMLHRPTTRFSARGHIWLSYVSVADVLEDVTRLTTVRRHEHVLAPEQSWEANKVGAGTPPVRLDCGWLLPYHAVSSPNGRPRYSMGIAVLDLERPARILYRTPAAVLEPFTDYERDGRFKAVVFPSAADLRADGTIDIYYGAADNVIAAARMTTPQHLPPTLPAITRRTDRMLR
jgi:predicted GH43/DUF377 family glycosyl hydrolase